VSGIAGDIESVGGLFQPLEEAIHMALHIKISDVQYYS